MEFSICHRLISRLSETKNSNLIILNVRFKNYVYSVCVKIILFTFQLKSTIVGTHYFLCLRKKNYEEIPIGFFS